MKKIIRAGVFETNSSSTHSLTLVDFEDFEKWKRGELLYSKWKGELIKAEEQKGKCAFCDDDEEDCEDDCDYDEDERLLTYTQFFDEADMETFDEVHTCKNGTRVVAFGYFGWDG